MSSRRRERAALQVPLHKQLTDPLPRSALERVRRRVHESRRSGEVRVWRRASAWAPVALGLALAAIGFGVWRANDARDVGPLRMAGGAPLGAVVARTTTTRIALHEGSSIALSPGARLVALENGSERVLLTQGDGTITYDVHPHGPRRWTIDAGAVAVDVIGTRFTIEREGSHVTVSVERGQVRVRGVAVAGGLRSLSAGEALEVGAPPRAIESETRGAAETAADVHASYANNTHVSEAAEEASMGESRNAASPTGAVQGVASAQRWLVLAARGEHRDAFDALGADGFQRATARSRSVSELFALADTARLSGHAALAVAPLERLLTEHAGDPRAGLAALTLGRLQLDALDAPGDACGSLERAITLGVPADLAEVAYARLVEAHRRAGHREPMAASARAYLERFPGGRNAAHIRQIIPNEPE